MSQPRRHTSVTLIKIMVSLDNGEGILRFNKRSCLTGARTGTATAKRERPTRTKSDFYLMRRVGVMFRVRVSF